MNVVQPLRHLIRPTSGRQATCEEGEWGGFFSSSSVLAFQDASSLLMSEGGGVLKAAATAGVINLPRAPGLAIGQWIQWVGGNKNGAPEAAAVTTQGRST